ncbi:hypothetical protein PRIC2_006406 [Phytophthora ramorum]
MEGTQTLSARALLDCATGLPLLGLPLLGLLLDCRGRSSRSSRRSSTAPCSKIFPSPQRYGARLGRLVDCVDRHLLPRPADALLPGPQTGRYAACGSKKSAQQMSSIKLDAPSHGAYYVVLMCVASVGYVLADVAADELSRDVATHHFGVSESPQAEDGVFQPVMTKYRVFAMLFCFLLMGVGMSGWGYGGDFDFSLEYTQVMLLPLNDTVVSFVAICVVLWGLNSVDKKGWDVDYRTVIIVGTIITLVLACGTTLFTIWGVVRSQWFWIGLPVMEAIPSALDYTISTAVLSEVADPNAHTTMSSLVTSVSFLAGPLGLAVSKCIDAQFDVTNEDVMTDTTPVREQIMATFFIAYGMQLASLLWLFALSKHEKDARELKLRDSTSAVRGAGLLILLSASLLLVVAVHSLSVFEPTSCLGVSGGKGC